MSKAVTQSALENVLDLYHVRRPIVSSAQTKKQKCLKPQTYHLDVNALAQFPASVFWMNNKRIYTGCNEIAAWAARVASHKDFTNRAIDNFETIPKITREIYSDHDRWVLNNKAPLHAAETIRGNICMSHKVPLYDKDNKLAGMLGISFIIKNYQEKLTNKLLTAISAEKLQQSFANKNTKQSIGAPLSRREKECIRLAMLNHSAKEIGKILSISNRTVEDYLENAKNKLGCSKRSELIQAALLTGEI